MLHVVDLDGALEGTLKNFALVKKITQSVKIPVQTGGGVRSHENIEKLLLSGVSRVILGTRVVSDKRFLKEALSLGQDKIAVSLDCSDGKVTQRGWTEISNLLAVDFAKELEQSGLHCLIYTDIARDGMLTGPNIEGLEEILNSVKIDVIASGGISELKDIKKLLALKAKNLIGAITGKAIYENKLDFKKAIHLCSQSESYRV